MTTINGKNGLIRNDDCVDITEPTAAATDSDTAVQDLICRFRPDSLTLARADWAVHRAADARQHGALDPHQATLVRQWRAVALREVALTSRQAGAADARAGVGADANVCTGNAEGADACTSKAGGAVKDNATAQTSVALDRQARRAAARAAKASKAARAAKRVAENTALVTRAASAAAAGHKEARPYVRNNECRYTMTNDHHESDCSAHAGDVPFHPDFGTDPIADYPQLLRRKQAQLESQFDR